MNWWKEKADGNWDIWFLPDGEGGTLAEWRRREELDMDPEPRDIHDAVLPEVVGDYEAVSKTQVAYLKAKYADAGGLRGPIPIDSTRAEVETWSRLRAAGRL